MTIEQPPRHNPHLDWLRFFASLAVVLNHTRTDMFVEYGNLEASSKTAPVFAWALASRLGYEAVVVFFVLSGFLVGGSAWDLAAQGRFSPGSYILDRTVRILVPLTAAIALTVGIMMFVEMPVDPLNAMGNLLSLQGAFTPVLKGNNPLWTLSYEVWFYVIGGAVAALATSRRYWAPAIIALGAAAVVFALLNLLYLLIWIAGAGAYRYRVSRPHWGIFALGILLALVGTAVCQLSLPTTANPEGHDFRWGVGVAVITAGVALFLPQLYVSGDMNSRYGRVGTSLASFSYSLYLIHAPLLMLQPWKEATSVDFWSANRYVFVVILLLIAAFAFSRLFEVPGPAMKAFVRTSRQQRRGRVKV